MGLGRAEPHGHEVTIELPACDLEQFDPLGLLGESVQGLLLGFGGGAGFGGVAPQGIDDDLGADFHGEEVPVDLAFEFAVLIVHRVHILFSR